MKQLNEGTKALYQYHLKNELKKRFNKLRDFIATVNDLDETIKLAAIREFIANKRDEQFEVYEIMCVQNSLEMVRLLAEILDTDKEVTEENRFEVFKSLKQHIENPHMEAIREIVRKRREDAQHSSE